MTPQWYAALILDFLIGVVSTPEFERRYLAAFKSEPPGMHPLLFEILNDLFSDVDAYSPDCLPGQETDFQISEERLRQQASSALARLKRVLHSG